MDYSWLIGGINIIHVGEQQVILTCLIGIQFYRLKIQHVKNTSTEQSFPLKAIELIDRKELARRLGVDQRTIYNMEQRKQIPSVRVSRCVRYCWETVLKALPRR